MVLTALLLTAAFGAVLPLVASPGSPPPPSGAERAQGHSGVVPSAAPAPATALSSAPVGLADPGAQMSFSTSGLRGVAVIHQIATYNSSFGLSAASQASLQLNAFLTFRSNGSFFDYWSQVVLELDTSQKTVSFEDNVWNATSPGSSVLNAAVLLGNGSVSSSSSGDYYADTASATLPGAVATLVYPSTVELGLNSSADGLGRPVVHFWFDDGFGPQVFDDLTFRFAAAAQASAGFNVTTSLFTPACPRCIGDAEFVWGGPYSGFQTTLSGPTRVEMSLERWAGGNYVEIPEASSLGIATAEGLTNGAMSANPSTGGVPNATMGLGALAENALWSPSELARLHVSVGTTHPSGSWALNGTGGGGFVNGTVDLLAWPGVYDLTVQVGTGTYAVPGILLSSGQWATVEVGAIAVVFLPQGLPNGTVWSVSLGNSTLRGTGPVTFGTVNGSWPYTVSGPSGFAPSASSGTVTVNGTAVYVQVNWTQHAPTLGEEIRHVLLLPVGPVPLWVVVVLLALFGVAAGWLGRSPRRRRPVRAAPGPAPWEP